MSRRIDGAVVGRVKWIGPCDITGCDLARIISIEHEDLRLYEGMDPSEWPPAGEKLNRRARAELYGVEAAGSANMAADLRAHTEDVLHAEFLGYEGGTWSFVVTTPCQRN